MRRGPAAWCALFAFGAIPLACSLRPEHRAAALPSGAPEALAAARVLTRAAAPGWEAPAREAATRAAGLAPGWVAPERVLDDLLRDALLGPEALAARRAALEDGATAEELYLAGRLEGREGLAALERAAQLDPTLSWAHHGVAWTRYLAGDVRLALRSGQRARERARGSYELGQFASAEARYLEGLRREDDARELLERTLRDARLSEPERTELGVALACLELEAEESETEERGYRRALALFDRGEISTEESRRLVDALLAPHVLARRPEALERVFAALGPRSGVESDLLRARLLALLGAGSLSRAALERAGSVPAGSFARARALERGLAQQALEEWLAALPRRVLDDDGLPREPALRALVQAARACATDERGETAPDVDDEVLFGAALIEAGWFEEAASWASALAPRDGEAALMLRTRASEGRSLLAEVRALLTRVDERAPVVGEARDGMPGAARRIGDLDELLDALQTPFERWRGAPLDPLVDSPRLEFSGLAALVHPGPRYSALDEAEGRGAEGAAVPGLAAEFARIGRFAIFGEAPGGGGPDGAVLRLVGGEPRSGSHLGVPFAGFVAWCEGSDVESRPARFGSPISGAALHEGYWVDIEAVRRDLERVRALERDFLGSDRGALERALAVRGPRVPAGTGKLERARWMAPLGEGERVWLSVLRERAAASHGGAATSFGAAAGLVQLDELLDLTALHEEGHLTDRTRFLPLTRRWPQVLSLLLRHGFTPVAVGRALEYRAQLVALCAAPDPRLPLAECLAAADGDGSVLPHGDAYRELLRGFLRETAAELAELGALDPERYLLYQLHVLSAEEVRRIARRLAAAEGLISE